LFTIHEIVIDVASRFSLRCDQVRPRIGFEPSWESLLLAVAFGIGAFALHVWTQKGSALVWLFGSVVWLMSGTVLPVSVLPAWVSASPG